jgi:two-component system, OmpR family, phosphate regulon sensor histidine kinase PhoR
LRSIFIRIIFLPFIALFALQTGLYFYMDFWSWEDRFRILMPYSAGSAVFVLFLAGFFSFWTSRNITGPLLNLLKKINSFPDDKAWNTRASGIPEINEFFQVIGTFMVRLRTQIKDLHLEKELLSSLLNNLQEGVLCLNPDGIIIFQNGRIDPELVEPDSEGEIYFRAVKHPRMLECINSRDTENTLTELDLKLSKKHFKMMGYPIVIENRMELYLIILQDDTQEQSIKRLREDFLQNASHELKTPITSIRGYSEALQNKTLDTRQSEYLRAILRNVERMERLIEDMAAISSLESGLYPFRPENINITDFMTGLTELVKGNLKQKKQTLTVNISNDVNQVNADPLLLEHLLLNLIVNASRYSPENSHITILIEKSTGESTLFSVIDEGPGIEEEFREKIFERFFRADHNRSRAEGGTGLGLSIVRQITRMHGGDVWVEPGITKGAVFRVRIPA